MKYRITGADRGTGEDRTIVVDADDERQAQLRAKEKNVLVEHVERDVPTPVYETINKPTKFVPHYPKLRDASASLYGSGQTMRFLGYLSIGAAVLSAIAMVVLMVAAQGAEAYLYADKITGLGASAVTLVIFGLILLWAGSMAKGVASMGEALRDLTINSHQR